MDKQTAEEKWTEDIELISLDYLLSELSKKASEYLDEEKPDLAFGFIAAGLIAQDVGSVSYREIADSMWNEGYDKGYEEGIGSVTEDEEICPHCGFKVENDDKQ